MNILAPESSADVLSRWGKAALDDDRFKYEVLKTMPADARWMSAELESGDVARLYCISRPEWVDLTQSTFQFARAAANLERVSANPHTLRIQDDVGRMLRWIREFDPRGLRMFAISDTVEDTSPVTLIDGVIGALALSRIGRLAGASISIAVSPQAREWRWSREAYRSQPSIPRPASRPARLRIAPMHWQSR